jgi:hypothetical protein
MSSTVVTGICDLRVHNDVHVAGAVFSLPNISCAAFEISGCKFPAVLVADSCRGKVLLTTKPTWSDVFPPHKIKRNP